MPEENKIEKIKNALRNGDFDFIHQNDTFQILIEANYLQDILFIYFSGLSDRSNDFEVKLAQEIPVIFVTAVRRNQYFLREKRIDFLLSLPLPEELKIHQKAWEIFHKQEYTNWKKLEAEIDLLQDMTLSNMLIYCVLWIEQQHLSTGNTPKNDQRLASVYNVFIEVVIYGQNMFNNEWIDQQSFIEGYFKSLTFLKSNPLQSLFEALESWINCKDGAIAEYAWDNSIRLEEKKSTIFLNQSPESYYNWNLYGLRYRLMRLTYNLKNENDAHSSVMSISSKEKLQPFKNRQKNFEFAYRQISTKQVMQSLGIESIEVKKKPISLDSLLIPNLIYSVQKKFDFELALDKIRAEHQNWQESLLALEQNSLKDEEENFPFFLKSKNEWIRYCMDISNKFNIEFKEDSLKLFRHTFESRNKIDRFNLKYDVWQKPFFEFDGYLFCPMIFIANSDWFYNLAQVGIRSQAANKSPNKQSKEERKSIAKMEDYLVLAFQNAGFKTRRVKNQDPNRFIGDVDVIVEDDEFTLLIQLKRSYFRLNFKDQYTELLMAEKKAIQQLNLAEQSFGQANNICTPKAKCIKWFVSTSFEGVNKKIKGCRKINYFELLTIIEQSKGRSLNELIDIIEGDAYLLTWIKNYNESTLDDNILALLTEAGLPMKMVEPDAYYQPILSTNKKNIESIRLFYTAIDMHKTGKHEIAIEQLNICIDYDKEDFKPYSAIANVYADIKDFVKANLHFKKAMSLAPNDPWITKNYILTLLEQGRVEEGFRLAENIFQQYPFLSELYFLLMKAGVELLEKNSE